MGDAGDSDLAVVLRRLVADPRFADEVLADPLGALAPYRLTAADLGALAAWLEQRRPGAGIAGMFDDRPGGDSA